MTTTMKVPIVIHQGVTPATRNSRFVSAPATGTKTKHLASRLQQNWMARHPNDTCSNGWVSLDDSLTSLSWLQNLNILKIAAPAPSSSLTPQHGHRLSKSRTPSPVMHIQVGMSDLAPLGPPKFESGLPLADTAPLCSASTSGLEGVDYRANPYLKPPFSYATLICMAMKETKKQKITLSSIYNWITENFMYYRMADPSWQNSIRHNLSLNKCFEKVPRRKDEPGKGGFWRINPEYSDMIENGIFKKRKSSRDTCLLPPSKRVRREDEELLVAVNSIKGVREDKLLSNGMMLNFAAKEFDEDDSFMLRSDGDFNWTAILNQDIDIGGMRIKTEQIIDGGDSGPMIAMSPPSSETNSDDLGLEDLFSQTDISMKVPLDYTTHDPLDLTVTGRGIRPPRWWGDSLLEGIKVEPQDPVEHSSGLHTPVAPSPNCDREDLWGSPSELDGSNAFDLDNLFDIGNIPSPQML